MVEKLKFYINHSINDLKVSRRLTFFSLLAIAAGVAAIVSLQTLTVMIGDTLEGNLQETNRGDVNAGLPVAEGGDTRYQRGIADGTIVVEETFFFGDNESEVFVSEVGVNRIREWISQSVYADEVTTTYRLTLTTFLGTLTSFGRGTALTVVETGEQRTSLSAIVVDADTYPLYGEVVSLEGEPLRELLQSLTDIVVSANIARDLQLSVGDVVQLNGSDADFTVRGVVPAEAVTKSFVEGKDLFAGLFGFYYLDLEAASLFDDYIPLVSKVYFRLRHPDQLSRFETTLSARYPYLDTTTTEDLREFNTEIVTAIGDFVTVTGLVALLIGSIGIVHTMRVIVRRRTLEIAVLKAIGLQGRQITLLFLAEAFVLGVFGSLLGIVLGWGLTFAIKGVAESVFGTDLPFRAAFQPARNGFLVGVLVTTVFGSLPTLAAGLVRPSIVLRPTDNFLPKAGILRTLGVLLAIITALSLIAQTILNKWWLSFAAVGGAFVAAGILYLVLWLLIWLISRLFPSLGIVDLKIALRQMRAERSRGASTLMALVIGVFSLSLMTLFVDATLNFLSFALEEQGNVLISAQSKDTLGRVEERLSSVEGVRKHTTMLTYTGTLVRFTDSETQTDYTATQTRRLLREAEQNTGASLGDPHGDIYSPEELLISPTIEARTLHSTPDFEMVQGRNLTPDDAGQPVLVLTKNSVLSAMGVSVGDTLTYNVRGDDHTTIQMEFEIVGIRATSEIYVTFTDASSFVPIGVVPQTMQPDTFMMIVDVDEDHIVDLRRELTGMPGVFVLEISVFTKLLQSLVDTFTAFPTMVAVLGLIVGGVVIANSVALSTLERRREIAVMKAIGLQREHVLGMLLLENGLLGFVGGLIGVGIGAVALTIIVSQTGLPTSAIPYATVAALMLLCVGIAVGAALSSAWSASGEKPLNVLRYE